MKCKTCKWFIPGDTTNLGKCAKYHPNIGQPKMWEDEFCGEWQTKVSTFAQCLVCGHEGMHTHTVPGGQPSSGKEGKC